ncbi:hypothetical protein QQ045_014687 [Rhodiola kirilowii]
MQPQTLSHNELLKNLLLNSLLRATPEELEAKEAEEASDENIHPIVPEEVEEALNIRCKRALSSEASDEAGKKRRTCGVVCATKLANLVHNNLGIKIKVECRASK